MASSSSSSSSSHIPSGPVPLVCDECSANCVPVGIVSGSGGVRSYNGVVELKAGAALMTRGFNFPFGTELQYNNFGGGGAWAGFGANWQPVSGLAGLSFGSGEVLYHEGPNSVKIFIPTTGGNYQAAYFVLDRLYFDGTNYKLTNPDGSVKTFNGSGLLTSFQNGGGYTGAVIYSGGGQLQSVSMTDGTDSWQFDYAWNGAGLVERVTFNLNASPVRKSEYTYDGSGNLKTIKNYAYIGGSWGTSGQTVEAVCFTYHSSSGLLRHVITPTNWDQMVNNGITDPGTLDPSVPADLAVLDAYAETQYAYYGSGEVEYMYTHGKTYTYHFVYTPQSQASTSLNVWTARTEITQPDGSLLRYYFNRGGQVILRQMADSAASPTKTWNDYSQQFEEDTGRLLVKADADAISTVNQGIPALVTLFSSAGRIEVFAYYSYGQVYYTGVRKGTGGTINRMRQFAYTSRSVTGLGTIYVPSSSTVYRGEGSMDGVATTYGYTWGYTGTFQMSQRVTTLPVVPTGENGTGTAATRTENFDQWGYLTSSVDERGSTTQYTYSKVKGALTQTVGNYGGLGLTTDFTLDDLSRTTLTLQPEHSIDLSGTSTPLRRAQWTYYKDREGEIWTFGGYRKTTGSVDQIVGPVTINRPNAAPPSGYTGYRQASVIDAVYSSAGIPASSYTFAQSTWVRWTMALYTSADQLTEEWKYFVIPSSGYGAVSTNYGKKLFAYDTAGRLNQTTCAGGTIDKTTFNAMGWAVTEELGTSGGLTVTRTNEYFDNGTLKKVTLPVDGTPGNDRVTENTYDYRHRLTESKITVVLDAGSTVLFTRFSYDNRDLVTLTESYFDQGAGEKLSGKSTDSYDALARRYRAATYSVNSSGTPGTALTDDWFYDVDGQIAREALSGSTLTTVTQYDILGRVTLVLQATGSFSSATPSDVSSAIVMEQSANVWDNGGNLISTTSKQRFDTASGNGALNTTTAEPKARISYVAIYPDALGRTQAIADYGTYGASAWSRPATIAPRSSTVLVTSTLYSSAGNVSTVTDPAGIITSSTWDKADRLTTLVENQPGGSSSSSSSGYATDVRTTRYEYTDDGWLKKLKSDNAATGQQITEWVYGVTPGQGSGLYSNRLVYQKKYPDYTGGSDLVTYTFNRQQQVISMTDQAGTAHTYAYDLLGRLLSDTAALAGGSVVNSTILKLSNGYNNRGLLIRATSYNGTGPTVNNEVQWVYNDFNQPTTEFQEHGGPVNILSSLNVQYGYVNGSGNTARPTGLTYPDATSITWEYVSSLSGALSRPDAVRQSSTTLASFLFLGLSVPVNLKYDAAANTQLTMRDGTTDGDSGDVYTGLDRFGRLVETIWKASSTEKVHTKYGRNRVGGVTWQNNVLAPSTEANFYWYDGLRQNYQHQRGQLAGSPPNYTGITSLQQTEVRSFDETGNWLSDYTSSPALTQSRVHNKANEITNLSGPSLVVVPVHDAAGNMTTLPKPDAWTTSCTCRWDAWNRMVEIKQGATSLDANVYDALTRRIRKITPSETRDYYYDKQWRVIEEQVGSTVKAQFVWSPFDRWTLIRRQRSVSGTLDETLYCLKDYLDPSAVIDSSATVLERFSYDSFGPVRFLNSGFVAHSSSTTAWNFLFHAEFRDDNSGLYNYGYRFYDPALGRWLNRDPIAEDGGLNLYKMTGNNAVSRIDNFGLLVNVNITKNRRYTQQDYADMEEFKQHLEDVLEKLRKCCKANDAIIGTLGICQAFSSELSYDINIYPPNPPPPNLQRKIGGSSSSPKGSRAAGSVEYPVPKNGSSYDYPSKSGPAPQTTEGDLAHELEHAESESDRSPATDPKRFPNRGEEAAVNAENLIRQSCCPTQPERTRYEF